VGTSPLTVKLGILIAGAMFTDEQKDGSTELAFKYAVYRINKDRMLLPNSTLVYDIQHVPRDDSFRAAKKGRDAVDDDDDDDGR
jgi:ionotropic glutamate receptor